MLINELYEEQFIIRFTEYPWIALKYSVEKPSALH